MPDKKSLKVGDKIVEIGHVYWIFKTETSKNKDGDKIKTIFFKSYYKNKNNRTVISSIPAQNIKKANIRKPLKKAKLKKLLTEFPKKPESLEPLNLVKARDTLKLNSPKETMKVLRKIWIEKKERGNQLTKSKKDVYELALNRLQEEIAFVDKISLKKAREKINNSLNKLQFKNPY